MKDCFYKDGIQFECQKCSRCCCKEPGYVYLSKRDLTELIKCFKINEKEFINKYCRFVPYYDGTEVLCLKEKPGYDCILWNNGCSAYIYRPIQCSTYPFWSFILKSKYDWDETGKSCPGINKGKVHLMSFINAEKEKYINNLPLRKGEI